ncbi:transcriptional regulator [Allokutzneria sp. A3M-2-11 16]|uniref:AfsR/SARP family transcriptional regulator n=1 Tax=Allokutzneria sp. A3M-2-11 16 TaxID=2962043 RepID=UPI0020B6521D|nr:transcriptional regulator [Allokutzneria sp. A3M-2-11 16]MCP3798496.1 transcriptional regulator [Allokutzneria sp. A3M-2-11 16]
MDFRVLGALEIIGPQGRVELGAPKQRALAAALLCRAGQAFSTDALIEALWGENPPRSARKNIQVYVYQVRKAFAAAGAPDRLHLEHAGYRLVVNPGELDIDRFNELFARGRTELTTGDAERAAQTLRDSMSLWRGEPFADLPDVEFLNRQAEAWRERRLAAEEARIEADLRAGRHTDVVDELFCLVRAHPLHEQFRAQLMTALMLGERKTEALAVYDHGRQLLASELGIAPGANLTRAHQAVLSGKATGFPTGARPRSPATTKKIVPRQLPRGLSDFVGRQAQLTTLGSGLARATSGGWPLLVLTGAAGVGKSALAIRAAHLAATSFPDGQLYVDLAEHNGGDALGHILRALGCAPADLPAERCEQQALYRTLVADRSVLIVLDNAANESQVRSLLPGSPRSAAIVTARGRLLGLDSAELVELGGFRSGESAQVLLGRAEAAAEPDAVQYAEFIADACDHLPVAVRIAAVRASGRSLQETARRLVSACNPLDELVAGDESVRARFTSCYGELDLIGKTALRRLGTLSSVEFTVSVLASLLGTSAGHAERSLDQLLDRHLVRRVDDDGNPHRFALSRLTHHFAMELARDPALPRVS